MKRLFKKMGALTLILLLLTTFAACDSPDDISSTTVISLGEDSRGPERIVYSSDGLIYYTPDHYDSFELLYGEE